MGRLLILDWRIFYENVNKDKRMIIIRFVDYLIYRPCLDILTYYNFLVKDGLVIAHCDRSPIVRTRLNIAAVRSKFRAPIVALLLIIGGPMSDQQ